jgi:hypothetical protein
MHARVAIAGLAVAGALALSASAAFADGGVTTVHCGQTLTHSVKLANDLTNCPGDGLVIGADGITVDLNDHTIDGTVTQTNCDPTEVPRIGIHDAGGYDDVKIIGGTVQQFDGGIRATDVNDSRVHDLNAHDARFGGIDLEAGFPSGTQPVGNRVDHNDVSGSRCGSAINLFNGQGNRFDHNRVRDAQTGISVCCGPATNANIIEDNSVAHTANFGILVFAAGVARVQRNDLVDIGSGDDGCAALNNCIGINIGGDGSGTVVNHNAITRSWNAGIEVDTCFDCGGPTHLMTDVRISDNALTSTGDGIWLIDTDRDVITRNTVTGAGSFGNPAAFGLGVFLHGVSDTRVSRNTITDGGRGIGPGIVIGLPPEIGPSPRPVNSNVVVRNTVSRQHADGILVAPVARDTTLARNTANGNAGDGIQVLSPFTTLTRNSADNNGAYGIEAIPGVTDGGFNEAGGTGNPAQSTGVACS